MNKKIIITIVLGTIALLSILYFGVIKKDPISAQVAVEDDHAHEAASAGKEVHLNQAQIKNANLAFGWYEKKNLNEVIHANGYTKLPPQNEADVSVFTSGIIKRINVIEGQPVKKGEVLAILESPEITKLQQAYLVSKANLTYLELEYDRQVILAKEDVNAKRVLQKVESDLLAERANYNALNGQLKLLKVNGEGATKTTLPILSPISGNITEVLVKIGTAVQPSKALFSIVDNSEMHVDLLVYEKDLYRVKVGQKVRFVLTNQSNTEINGRIFNIGKSFENETKTVAVHADIDKNTNDLIPGMYVNALIDVGLSEVNALPESAIVTAEGRQFIFIVNLNHEEHDDGHDHSHDHSDETVFRRIEVKQGAIQLGYAEVTVLEDIPKGYKIVTQNAYYLQSHLQKSEGGGGHSH